MRARQRSIVDRDQAVSPFNTILHQLCDAAGAIGAALVDREGETVDYAGEVDPYEIRVAAAEWRLVLAVLAESAVPNWADTTEIVVRSAFRSFVVVSIGDGYAIVAQLPLHCFSISQRALSECARELCKEAGFGARAAASGHWTRIAVRTAERDRWRPQEVWLDGEWRAVEILGRYPKAELGRGERGYRARLTNGAELTLVREPLGRWYAEDMPEHGPAPTGA
jgi:hypothetical protein